MTAPSPNRTYQQERSHLAFLKLHAAAEHLAPVLDAHGDADHVTVLEKLLGIEAEATRTRRTKSRRRLAGLPAAWRLADFDYDAQPAIDPKLIADLATMRFLDDAGNVLFIGPPGVGKTMLAVARVRLRLRDGKPAHDDHHLGPAPGTPLTTARRSTMPRPPLPIIPVWASWLA